MPRTGRRRFTVSGTPDQCTTKLVDLCRRGLSFFVYANMLDYMRRVADDVFIGSAVRGGREMGSYFVVVRELPGR